MSDVFHCHLQPVHNAASSQSTTIYFVRHGLTLENLNYTLIGHTDAQLHPIGIRQAEAVAASLVNVPLAAIYTSPLARCRETSNRIATPHRLAVQSDSDLREVHLGIVDGMSSFTAYHQYQSMMDEALEPNRADFAFPKGEARTSVVKRFTRALLTIATSHPQASVCVVTHGGPLGLWLAHLHNEPLGSFRQRQPKHASISRVVLSLDDARTSFGTQIDTWNDTSHLPASLEMEIREVRKRLP